MAISQTFDAWTNGWMATWNTNCYVTNFQSLICDEDEAEKSKRLARIKQLCAEAIAHLRDSVHRMALKPWLIVAKRFDFRTAPRWSCGRWKSKT